MTQVEYDQHGLTVGFPGWESMMTGRSTFHVPAHAIRAARAEPGWTS